MKLSDEFDAAGSDEAALRYETMPLEEVHEELRAAGINPAPTIAAVKQLIEDRIAGERLTASNPTPAPARRTVLPASSRSYGRREPAP